MHEANNPIKVRYSIIPVFKDTDLHSLPL